MKRTIPTGHGELALKYRLTGDPELVVLTCGFLATDGADADPAAIAEQVRAAVAAAGAWNAVISNVYVLVEVTVVINVGGVEIPIFSTGTAIANVPGANGAAPLPQNTAWLLRKNSAFAGRRGKGRMYVPGIAEAIVGATGQVQADYLDDLAGAATALYTALVGTAGIASLVIIHSGPDSGPNPPVPTTITSFGYDQVVATQRRRLRR